MWGHGAGLQKKQTNKQTKRKWEGYKKNVLPIPVGHESQSRCWFCSRKWTGIGKSNLLALTELVSIGRMGDAVEHNLLPCDWLLVFISTLHSFQWLGWGALAPFSRYTWEFFLPTSFHPLPLLHVPEIYPRELWFYAWNMDDLTARKTQFFN